MGARGCRCSVRGKHIYAQVIDDRAHAHAWPPPRPTRRKARRRRPTMSMRPSSVGKKIAERAIIAAGVKQVVFDRGGYIYHGRIKAAGRRGPRRRPGILRT
ncbi:MAG: 50S ribosomal protein L18 [Rhizomicrobium sp.]